MNQTYLSIIIVSWNTKNLLADCLESIYKNQEDLKLEIIIVDNNSTDGTLDMIQKKFPQVMLIPNQHNVGFAKANNQGIAQSHGEYFLFLNPDTKIIKNSLKRMLDFMEEHQNAGIAGCKHLNPDFTLQPSIRRFPTFWALFFIFTKLAKIFPGLPVVYNYLAKDFDYKSSQRVDQVAGSFLMIRKKALDQVGLFDENFFIWFEEVDLCKRAKNANWEVWYNHSAEIIHYGGQSFKQQLTVKKQKMFFTSAWYYFKKNGFR